MSCSAHHNHSLEKHLGETFVGVEDFQAKDSGSGWGCSVPWSRRGGGYWRQGNGKEEDLGENIQIGEWVCVSVVSFLGNLYPSNLGSGSSQFSEFLCFFFVTLKGIKQGIILPGPFPCHPKGMRAKCQDMQMRLEGNNRQEGLMAASPPIPKSTIKYSNGILLEGRRRGLPDDAGQKLGVAGSSRKGEG